MEKDQINNEFFNLNPLPSWISDNETLEILDVNSAAIEHYGYSREEFLSLTLKDLRPPEEVSKLINANTEIKTKEGNIYLGIFTHQKKNGTLIQMEINGHRVDINDRPCLLVVCQDVTEKQNQLRQLQASEAKLKTATSIAKLGYWSLDLNSNTLSWSDEVYEIWGVDRDTFELTYDRFLQTIHPDDQDAFTKEQDASLAGKKIHDFVHRIIRPDNSIRWVHELGRLVKDKNGKAFSFEGTVQDITEQKQEEQRLKLLESVITHTNDAVMITEAEPVHEPGPRILYVNEAFTQMTGYTLEEVIGKTPRMLQGPNSDEAELARLGKALRNRETCEITTINYKKNGEEFWNNFSVSPVADEKGFYTHFIAIERDITEQKQKELEKELLGKISLNFSFENDLFTASATLCQTLSDYGHFDFVELWLPTLDESHIQLFAHQPASTKANTFYEYTKEIKSFEKGKGLPGIVWDKNATIFWNEINKEDDLVRIEAAESAGLASAMGIPLVFNEKIVGVLLVASHGELHHLKKYAVLFEYLRQFLGSEINRKKLENDLEHLYDAIPDIICITDLQGRFLKINKAGCDLIGQSEEEILHNTFEKFVHPDDKERSHKDLEKLNKGEKTFGFENRYINKNGNIIWLSWTSNSNLQEGLIYATARNITEEKRLRELNREVSKLAKIGSWEVDLANSTVFWSDMVHELHETDPKNFEPDLETGIHFYREDFREMVNEEVAKCIENGIPFDFEAVLITAKKNERWVRAIGNAEMVEGKCQRFYGSFQDIHERKIIELQKNSLLETLENSLNEIYIFDSETLQFSYVNKGALLNLGYSEDEIKTLTPLDLKPDFTATSFKQLITPLLNKEKEKIVFFTNHKRKNGSFYPVEIHLQLVTEANNKRFLAIILDITERKKAEKELRNAFEEKNNILESIGDAFFAVDKDWIVTYWNKEAETVLGRKREEIVGENLWEKYTDAIDSDFYRQYHKAMETGEAVHFEEHYPTLKKWFEVSAYPSEKGLSVYFKDVTLRKEADIRLLQANERFEKVTEATSDAIWDWDILNDTFYRSQNIQKFFGKSTSTVLSKKDFWLDAFHPDDQEVIKKSLSASLKDPNANRWEAEYRIINESGTIIYIIDRGLIIRDAEGNAIRMIGAMTDITELKQNEEKLKEANKRFEIVTEATNDAIWDYDVVNNKLFWGKGFLTLFGHNPDEITPTFDLLVSLIHEEDRERIVKQVNRYMSDPTLKDWYEEFRFLKADNTIAFVIDRATFIRNSKGKVIRVIGAMNDITDRKNFEQQLLSLNESLDSYAKDLERSNEELESFAFITSHDLQEPLRMITSFMDQLKRKYGEQMDERALQYIHFATDGAKRMKQIILDLLEYSRAGRLIETMEQVDINQLLSDFKQLRRKVISEKSVTITHAELPTIFSSKVTITQVLHSLLDNAIKYSKDGIAPHIELTVTEQKKEWKFSVKDNGIGIEPEFFDKIFIIFQRLHNRDKYDGTGIGLSIAKKNVEFLGGNIWVESTPGKGTTFYFNIPKS